MTEATISTKDVKQSDIRAAYSTFSMWSTLVIDPVLFPADPASSLIILAHTLFQITAPITLLYKLKSISNTYTYTDKDR